MGERKNLNKYIPPDFDPKKIPRLHKPKNQQKKIRFMLPFRVRVQCNTCGNYMSEGTKFNCREEDVINEMYLGIKIRRFYIKCTKCLAEITIKTDPKHRGYTVESGATCLYNGHEEKEEEKKKHEETENALESLEKRTKVSKREIEVMATLDEMKSMKSRRASVSVDSMLEALSRRKEQEEENMEEELLIKSITFGKRIKIDEEKNVEAFDEKKKKKPKRQLDCGKAHIRIMKKTQKVPKMGLESLCHNYGTDSDEEK